MAIETECLKNNNTLFCLHMTESSQLKPLSLAFREKEPICIRDTEGGYSLVCFECSHSLPLKNGFFFFSFHLYLL